MGNKKTVEAIDQVKVRAFHASRKMISEIECATSQEFNVMKEAAEKLADTIYEYETRRCRNCLYDKDSFCHNPKSGMCSFGTLPNFGCTEFVRVT